MRFFLLILTFTKIHPLVPESETSVNWSVDKYSLPHSTFTSYVAFHCQNSRSAKPTRSSFDALI